MTRSKGFSIVEVVIVIAILGLVGVIGWRVWSANQTETTESGTSQTTDSQAPDVKTDADLDKADDALNETNIEGSESQQLDTETSF